MTTLFDHWEKHKPDFEGRLKHLFVFDGLQGEKELVEAINYALFTGGKRFRPMLTLASSLSLKENFEDAMDWALSIEMIHTYSLIHDDLPCMDNDDYRRGLPTVHKKFGEACALLAGDALLTEAFSYLAGNEKYNTALPRLISLLAKNAGYQGMIGGQANDCLMDGMDKASFLRTHKQKTAALIQAAVIGPFIIHEIKSHIFDAISEFAERMGILFQIKDDILDFEQEDNDGLPSVISLEETQQLFNSEMEEAEQLLKSLEKDIDVIYFYNLLEYNSNRSH